MIRLSKIWYWVVIVVVVVVAAGLTTLFAQKNDVSISQKTNPSNNTNKDDTAAKIELQPEDSASSSTTGNSESTTKVELQRLFNDLRKEYLDTRDASLDRWMWLITALLALFGLVIPIALAVISYIVVRHRLREFEAEAEKSVEEARKLVEEIKAYRARAEEYMLGMTSEDMADPDETTKVEEAIRDVQSDPEPSLISKVIAEIYTLQRDGKIEDVIEKWRSIANIAEGNDNELAARAWLSIRYFLVEEEDQRDAYNKAMSLDPNYTRTYMNQYREKYSNLSPHGVVVGTVLRYFNDPKFEKFSTVQEYQIESGRYRADVVLQDEKGQLSTIVECMVNEYIPESTMTYLKEHFRRSGAQFGLLAIGPDISKWTFWKLEGEMSQITPSQFEVGIVESGSP